MLTPRRQRGFSIVELATAMTIIAILMAIGMPSLSEYLQNARLGSTAQNLFSGLNLARSEAIRRNQQVDFVLTSTPLAPGIENAFVADVAGTNWLVLVRDPVTANYVPPLDSRTALEGGGTNPTVTVTSTASIVSFTSLGATTIGVPVTINVRNPPSGACAPAGPVRCWQVQVTQAGQVHLCDPAAAVGDSRAC